MEVETKGCCQKNSKKSKHSSPHAPNKNNQQKEIILNAWIAPVRQSFIYRDIATNWFAGRKAWLLGKTETISFCHLLVLERCPVSCHVWITILSSHIHGTGNINTSIILTIQIFSDVLRKKKIHPQSNSAKNIISGDRTACWANVFR